MLSPSLTWLPLAATVFALGLRHGLDADHLATIDGLTRFNAAARPVLARWCGALFSAGHGCVVVIVATTMGGATARYAVPGWAADLGAWISIGFLLALGALNLALVVRTPPEAMVVPTGVRSRLLGRWTRSTRPLGIVLIGALFAISFDTLSQAALFAATAARFGGWRSGALLGLVFTVGMLVVDGANGLWIASLLRRADRRARRASRALGVFVALLSFTVAGLGIARYLSPQVDAILASTELPTGMILLGAGALGIVLIGFRYRSAAASGWRS
ncbi:MAG TPA: nickel transporter [Steroidobacteraceae bacterium]|nr:nickel transporter [Steroidobacteraceae bacterium]